jgi:EAL domain-containing protein (putative c-di-GMP-specific phosphodiesterase class I)
VQVHPESDSRIVSAIVSLAHTLGRTVVAEGVETPEQLAALREMRCDIAQGFLIARPLTAAATEVLYIETNQDRRTAGVTQPVS